MPAIIKIQLHSCLPVAFAAVRGALSLAVSVSASTVVTAAVAVVSPLVFIIVLASTISLGIVFVTGIAIKTQIAPPPIFISIISPAASSPVVSIAIVSIASVAVAITTAVFAVIVAVTIVSSGLTVPAWVTSSTRSAFCEKHVPVLHVHVLLHTHGGVLEVLEHFQWVLVPTGVKVDVVDGCFSLVQLGHRPRGVLHEVELLDCIRLVIHHFIQTCVFTVDRLYEFLQPLLVVSIPAAATAVISAAVTVIPAAVTVTVTVASSAIIVSGEDIIRSCAVSLSLLRQTPSPRLLAVTTSESGPCAVPRRRIRPSTASIATIAVTG